MTFGRAGFLLLALPLLLAAAMGRARATGVFEDAAADAGFLCAAHRPAVQARMTVTESEVSDASLYVLTAVFPVNSWFLLGLELPFVTAATDREIESGFGDLRFRGRMSLLRRPRRQLAFVWGVGTGSGTRRIFPYSSQALELSAAVAWSDTLEVVRYWVSAGGETVERAPDDLVERKILVEFGRVTAGTGIPFGSLGLNLGLSALFFRGGTFRDHYFAELTWDHRDIFRFFATAEMEGGRRSERVLNSAASVGMIVSF